MTDVELPDGPPMEPPTTDEQPTPGRRPSRWPVGLLIAAVVALLAVVVVVLVVLADDDGDDPVDRLSDTLPPAPTLSEEFEGQLTAEAQELLDLLARGEQGTYHAVYTVEGDPETTGGEITVEVWRDGQPRFRRNTRIVTDEGAAESAGIADGDRTVACQRFGDDPWECVVGDPAIGVADDIAGSVRDQLLGAAVRVRDDEIDGRDARCFEFGTLDGPGEVCASTDGVVLRLGTGPTVLRLTDLDDRVPGDVFDPPAEPG